MTLFRIESGQAKQIPKTSFKNEKEEIQKIIGNDSNLVTLFGLEFIENEVAVKGRYIDTLGYNKDTKSFVIFEYKKERNRSVIDQGFTYLSLMLDNKSKFVLEYNNKKKVHQKENDFDWSQSRVIFISPEYTDYQIGASNFKDLPFTLYKIKKYHNNQISIDEIKPISSAPSFQSLKKGGVIQKVGAELKIYTLDYHLEKIKDESIREIVNNLRENILKIDDSIKEYYTKDHIVFKTSYAFASIYCQTKNFWVDVRISPDKLNFTELKSKGLDIRSHKDKVFSHIRMQEHPDMGRLLELIKRAYQKTK